MSSASEDDTPQLSCKLGCHMSLSLVASKDEDRASWMTLGVHQSCNSRAAVQCRYDSTCLSGFESNYGGFVSAFLFATETQQTIGAVIPLGMPICLSTAVMQCMHNASDASAAWLAADQVPSAFAFDLSLITQPQLPGGDMLHMMCMHAALSTRADGCRVWLSCTQ